MLTHPTLDKLQALRLTGMVKGLEEQLQMTGPGWRRVWVCGGPAATPASWLPPSVEHGQLGSSTASASATCGSLRVSRPAMRFSLSR